MCGIFGCFSSHKSICLTKLQIESILNYLKHRGPDNYSIYDDENSKLIFTRLAINDLTDKGLQPFYNNDWLLKRIIIFNNFKIRINFISPKINLDEKEIMRAIILVIIVININIIIGRIDSLFLILDRLCYKCSYKIEIISIKIS